MISLRSDITKKILNYFFLNPEESLYVNELCRKLKVDKRNLVKKLKELEQEGILVSESKGNLKLYSVNRKYSLYNEYKKIIFKTSGLEAEIKQIINSIKKIKEAYIYGSYAKDKMDVYSDIDLLVVGDHSVVVLQRDLSKLQQKINREINVVNMDADEFKKRISKKDPFILSVLKSEHIKVK